MTEAKASMEWVRLVPVDNDNRADLRALSVKSDQFNLVASNASSLRRAAEDPSLVPRAPVDYETLVGFAMYQRRNDGSAYIWRVMVEGDHQGRGYGRRLMELLLAEIRATGAPYVIISHRPQNRPAAGLFESLGFEEVDFEPDGEVIRRLQLSPAGAGDATPG